MKTILVATDFSKGSENAIKYAKEIAQKNGSKLTYIHAYTPPILDPNIPVGMIEDTFKVTLEILEKNLKDVVSKDKSDGIESDYYLSFSDLSSLINEITAKAEVDLLVLGKTGHRTFLDKLIGSTANHVIDNIHVPLLVIPEEFESNLYEKVCYASQFDQTEETYIENALKVAKNSKNKLTIAHIFEDLEINFPPDEDILKKLKDKFKQHELNIIQLKSKNFSHGISDIIASEGISLLILTTHKRGFFEGLLNPSKTKHVISHTKIPVLIYSFSEK